MVKSKSNMTSIISFQDDKTVADEADFKRYDIE